MLNAVRSMMTVIKLAPVTDGTASEENVVKILKIDLKESSIMTCIFILEIPCYFMFSNAFAFIDFKGHLKTDGIKKISNFYIPTSVDLTVEKI